MPAVEVPPAALVDRALELAPRVALRPEPFGALAYHYDTRRLVFLKDRDLVRVVEAWRRNRRSAQRSTPAGSPRGVGLASGARSQA